MKEQLAPVLSLLKKLDFPGRWGGKAAELWLESPSPQDPNITNGEALCKKLYTDVYEGRPLSRRYLNPIEEACRRGLVKAAVEELEKKIREGEVLGELSADVIRGRSLTRRYLNPDKEARRADLIRGAVEDLGRKIRQFVANEGEI